MAAIIYESSKAHPYCGACGWQFPSKIEALIMTPLWPIICFGCEASMSEIVVNPQPDPTCLHCNKPYTPSWDKQKYCGSKCASPANSKR